MTINVWYVDDEKDLLDNFYDIFSSDQIKVEIFSEPQQAIDQSKYNPPDIIFLDFRLPKTTGDEIAWQFDPAIPKYLITGEVSVTTRYPFVEKISKPYNIDKIFNIINTYSSDLKNINSTQKVLSHKKC